MKIKAICFAVLMLFSGFCALSQQQMPNIVIILADDMGIGDVSGLNPESRISTPHIDKLIDQGMSFTDAHTASSVCTPTRYGLLTGRYPWRTELKRGVLNGYSSRMITDSVDTAPALLRRNGYQTAMIGKWHLGWDWAIKEGAPLARDSKTPYKYAEDIEAYVDFSQPFTGGPTDCGFDYFYGICASLDMPPYAFCENNRVEQLPTETQKVQGKPNTGQLNREDLHPVQVYMRSGAKAPDFDAGETLLKLTQKSVDYIQNADSSKPFFLYVAFTSPHVPVLPGSEFLGTSSAGVYGDFIQEMDWSIGQIMEAISEKGVIENTIIIFAADNGASKSAFPLEYEEKYDHRPSGDLRGRKGTLHEGGHRVPFIVQWKNTIAEGTENNVPICLNDLYATFAAIVGEEVESNQGFDSFNLMPLLTGHNNAFERESTIYTNFGGFFSIRMGDWKLDMLQDPNKRKLFNLKEDISEKKNLYRKDEYRDIVQDLMDELTAVIKDGRSTQGEKLGNGGESNWPQVFWLNNE